MSAPFTESIVEDAALSWLERLGHPMLYVPAIAAGEPGAERSDRAYRGVVLEGRFRQVLARLNPRRVAAEACFWRTASEILPTIRLDDTNMTMISKQSLGRLVRVELREAWQGESTDFTPWLAQTENVALLGEAIGIELEVESQEKSVGPFRADILCRDTINNHWVLIENQLERTDHGHLGQLLTYAAGLEAVTIIWIASQFTEEHRAALDWLNNVTTSGINFFGLEIELWQIGGSAMAPKFNVVSKPNDWSKTVREQATGSSAVGNMTEFQRRHLEFWTQFRQHLEDQGSPIRTNRPSKDHWSNVALGRSFFGLVPWNGMRDNRSGVYVQLTGADAKAHFHLIRQHHRDEIETKLSSLGTLDWRLLPNAKESQISLTRPSTPSRKETWPELNEWMATTLKTMHELFSPIVKGLNAAEFAPEDAQALADLGTGNDPEGAGGR